MYSKSPFAFPLDPSVYARNPVPSLEEWDQLWKLWDHVTRVMIPEEELLSKPINLRNCCIFYLGHIPTFVDIHITRATGGNHTQPSYYPRIFERGIDPDVENPELCHAHSEIPNDWPPLHEILDFQARVRERLRKLYYAGSNKTDRGIARALWLGYEHEAMHLETLLYMLLQSDKTVPPTEKPNFEHLAHQAHTNAKPHRWVTVPERVVELGMSDLENNDGPDRYFGWDIEKPPYQASVHSFEVRTQPLTNGDYAKYAVQSKLANYPASWIVDEAFESTARNLDPSLLNGYAPDVNQSFLHGKAVRTVYGPVPLIHALDWPVMASYNELSACATWMDSRIPSLEEVRSIHRFAEETNALLGNIDANTIPAVNGHLSNNGVEETPPDVVAKGQFVSSPTTNLDPKLLFADLGGCNVGFQAFHPLPVTAFENLTGLSGMGGVWEWTSSDLERRKDFEPMKLYPAYSSDFFDKKHKIVLGGSWATVPRLAGRKSFVNWYQRNYPYVWAGARLVRNNTASSETAI